MPRLAVDLKAGVFSNTLLSTRQVVPPAEQYPLLIDFWQLPIMGPACGDKVGNLRSCHSCTKSRFFMQAFLLHALYDGSFPTHTRPKGAGGPNVDGVAGVARGRRIGRSHIRLQHIVAGLEVTSIQNYYMHATIASCLSMFNHNVRLSSIFRCKIILFTSLAQCGDPGSKRKRLIWTLLVSVELVCSRQDTGLRVARQVGLPARLLKG